jgi:hypothetical protein
MSNGKMVLNHRVGMKQLPIVRYLPSISLEGLRKTMYIFRQDTWPVDPGPSEI